MIELSLLRKSVCSGRLRVNPSEDGIVDTVLCFHRKQSYLLFISSLLQVRSGALRLDSRTGLVIFGA